MEKVFFIGINGIGMSGLAKIMVQKGYDVYGSDIERKEITAEMEKMGIKVFIGHSDLNVKGMDFVVNSSAIKASNPEYLFAKLNEIPIIKRGELLAMLFNKEKGIAVAGTHGKTTTSSMMALAIQKLDPTIIVGGIIQELKNNSKPGNGEHLVAEADESDNSFLYLNPYYSIITNVEPDHLEYHGTFDNIKASFRKFMSQTLVKSIVCIDCPTLKELAQEHENIVTYSIKDEAADIFASNIRQERHETRYDVIIKGKNIGEFDLKIPGLHNVANSLGPIYIAYSLGIEPEEIRRILGGFIGAKRRFDILHDNEVMVIDDYAHHPTEIAATLKAARQRAKENRVVAIFQPHRYSRVKLLLDSFKDSFSEADRVIIMPIYSAGEKNIYDISEETLADNLGKSSGVSVIRDRDELAKSVIDERKKGDIIVFMGAGDIYKVAHKVSDTLTGVIH